MNYAPLYIVLLSLPIGTIYFIKYFNIVARKKKREKS